MRVEGNNKRLLLVDDDKDDVEMFFEAVTDIDDSIVCSFANDGREAIEKLNNKVFATPDLIFLDINMPEMNGWECLTALKKDSLFKNIPVIMYSTSSHKKLSQIAVDLGAICFFTKPDEYGKLREILTRVVFCLKRNSIDQIPLALS